MAAWLLKEQGYDVIGVTMQIWQDEDTLVQEAEGGCCGLSAVDDARRVAMDLGIPYYVMNFKNEFRTQVMDYFAAEYMAGRTPNPCIACDYFPGGFFYIPHIYYVPLFQRDSSGVSGSGKT